MSEGVSHKELNAALGKQTGIIIATLRRSEDRVGGEIKEVSDRVTYIERRSRTENIIASIVTFFGIILYGKISGGN